MEISFATDVVLDAGAEEHALLPCINACAENTVKRAGAECEVVSVDAAFGRAGDFYLAELLLDAARTAGRKFHTAKDVPQKRGVLGFMLIDKILSDEGNIADTGFGAAINRETLRTFEGTINDGCV